MLADGESPGRYAVAELSENPIARRVVSSLVLPLLLSSAGRQELVVLTGRAVRPIALEILTQCGLTDRQLAWPVVVPRKFVGP